MKTSLLYGAIAAVFGALMNLAMFFTGLHNDPADMAKNLAVAIPLGAIGFIVPIVLIVLSVRAWRNAQPDGQMSFGRGVGVGTLTGTFFGVFGGIVHVLYMSVINPAYAEAMLGMQLANLDAKPMPAEAHAMAEKMVRLFSNPALQAVMGIFIWAAAGLVVGLIAGAILKREPSPTTPPAVGPVG